MKLFSNLHGTLARLHGRTQQEAGSTSKEKGEFKAVYAEYAAATALANDLLQQHGPASPQFTRADVASIRLFHRAKKMQGLRKPREG